MTVNSKRLRLWNGFFDPFDTMNAHVEFHRFKHGLLCGFGDGDDPTDTAEDVESLYEKLGVPRVCVHIPSKGTVKVFGASHGQAKVRAMKLEVETLLCETAALCAR